MARYSVDPSLWGSVVSVAVASVGGILVGTANPLGGYGTGYGGASQYFPSICYGTGGGGGSSVSVGVGDISTSTLSLCCFAECTRL